MKLGPWLYLIMAVIGIIMYYSSEPLMQMLPQDKDGNVVWPYQTPVILLSYGWCLTMIALLYASYTCETELINRHKQSNS